MSKIGALNLELQEQAIAFGYYDLEQAIADGCEIDYINGRLEPINSNRVRQAMTDWEKSK